MDGLCNVTFEIILQAAITTGDRRLLLPRYRSRIVGILCIIIKKSQIKTDRRNSINDHSDDAKTHVSCFQSDF